MQRRRANLVQQRAALNVELESSVLRANVQRAEIQRNLALLELLYGSGLRATELVSLPRRTVRKGQPFLILRGKGDKERLVPVSSRAADAVEQWLATLSDGQWHYRPIDR